MKRGQAALEFLTTYGWAILVVLGMIGALAYFGVITPDNLLPEKCIFESGLGCIEFGANAGDYPFAFLNMTLKNSMGSSIQIVDTSFTYSGLNHPSGCIACNLTGANCSLIYEKGTVIQKPIWKADELREMNIRCGMSVSEKPKFFIEIEYLKGGGQFPKKAVGEVLVKPN